MPERFELVLEPPAASDIEDAANWYEDRVGGLGIEFLDEIDRCLESIRPNPQRFPVVHRDVRRALLRRFPYALFFVLRENVVNVIACTHTRRHPRRWQRRR
ncbi:MAG TPA: type II toxin-antitoxin system RelE/ParE family toxin [Longimicrobiales bacterium]